MESAGLVSVREDEADENLGRGGDLGRLRLGGLASSRKWGDARGSRCPFDNIEVGILALERLDCTGRSKGAVGRESEVSEVSASDFTIRLGGMG